MGSRCGWRRYVCVCVCVLRDFRFIYERNTHSFLLYWQHKSQNLVFIYRNWMESGLGSVNAKFNDITRVRKPAEPVSNILIYKIAHIFSYLTMILSFSPLHSAERSRRTIVRLLYKVRIQVCWHVERGRERVLWWSGETTIMMMVRMPHALQFSRESQYAIEVESM